MCPLCNSDDFYTEKNKRLQDPISRVYQIHKEIKTCKLCSLILYEHSSRGWEGGFFDDITCSSTYHMDNQAFKSGIEEYIKLRKVLPILGAKTKKQAIKLPISNSTYIADDFDTDTKKDKMEDAYYYKSSLKGIVIQS
jgi:hypothetical protein